MDSLTRLLLTVAAFCLTGALLWHFGILQRLYKVIPLGRLPGDLKLEFAGASLFLPITTCVLLSLLFSALLWLFRH